MLTMDPDREEAEVFSDPEDPFALTAEEKEEDEEDEEEDEEEDGDEDGDEEDARIFNSWMQRYRGGEQQSKVREEEGEEEESEGGRSKGKSLHLEPPVPVKSSRRASLPCPSTLSAMQLSRLHSSTQAPVTASGLLRRSSSRRLLPLPLDATTPTSERRQSLIPTIPEAVPPEKRGPFRRRNVMSLSDAYSVCLICHNDLNNGTGGTRELQCTHTFHKECIEEWLWRKQCCPTCHVQVYMPQPSYWNSTRIKVP